MNSWRDEDYVKQRRQNLNSIAFNEVVQRGGVGDYHAHGQPNTSSKVTQSAWRSVVE